MLLKHQTDIELATRELTGRAGKPLGVSRRRPGGPPVVLVHGVGSSHEHAWVAPGWTDVLAEDGRTVVPFELPGHGAAPPLAGGVDDADLLLAALDASGGVPVDAVGHSAGALLLLRAAARRPPLFRRIALIGVGDGVLGPPSDTGERLAEALEGPAEPADPRARVFWRLAASAGNRRADVAAYLRHRLEPAAGRRARRRHRRRARRARRPRLRRARRRAGRRHCRTPGWCRCAAPTTSVPRPTSGPWRP